MSHVIIVADERKITLPFFFCVCSVHQLPVERYAYRGAEQPGVSIRLRARFKDDPAAGDHLGGVKLDGSFSSVEIGLVIGFICTPPSAPLKKGRKERKKDRKKE